MYNPPVMILNIVSSGPGGMPHHSPAWPCISHQSWLRTAMFLCYRGGTTAWRYCQRFTARKRAQTAIQVCSIPGWTNQTRIFEFWHHSLPSLFFFFKLTLEKPSNLCEMNFIFHIKGNNNSELPSPHKKIPRSYFSHFFSGGGPCWAMFWVKRWPKLRQEWSKDSLVHLKVFRWQSSWMQCFWTFCARSLAMQPFSLCIC